MTSPHLGNRDIWPPLETEQIHFFLFTQNLKDNLLVVTFYLSQAYLQMVKFKYIFRIWGLKWWIFYPQVPPSRGKLILTFPWKDWRWKALLHHSHPVRVLGFALGLVDSACVGMCYRPSAQSCKRHNWEMGIGMWSTSWITFLLVCRSIREGHAAW